MQQSKAKTALVWVALVLLFMVAFHLMTRQDAVPHEPFETFLAHVENGQVAGIRIVNNMLTVSLNDGEQVYTTLGVVDDELQKSLSSAGVFIAWGEEPRPIRKFLVMVVPLLLVVALFVYFLRKAGGSGMNVMTIAKSRARLLAEPTKVTFDDIGGAREAKERLGDVIDFLKNPGRWTDAGARLPRGVLLEGPPGCGKTLLARAVAGEAEAKFFVISASEFVELFVGVGAARVRDMFETAQKQAPAVIFVDEFDAVGRRRGSGLGAGHDEREQTLNQLLVSLDGFEPSDRVVVLAATNRSDVLDPALLRPGRFDCRIEIPPFSAEERLETLRIHTRTKRLADDVSLEDVAGRTDGLTGAEIENLCNEAALLAVRRARTAGDTAEVRLTAADFERALTPRPSTLRFTELDTLLVDSATQLSQPTGRVVVRLTLTEERVITGDVVWMDAGFVKVRIVADDSELIVPKLQIVKIEALRGTAMAHPDTIAVDRWASQQPGLA